MRHASRDLESVGLWLGLLVAFSPALAFIGRRLLASPADRAGLLAVALFAVAAAGSRPCAPRAAGLAAIAAGAVTEILGIAVGSGFVTALGFPIAAVGLAAWKGRPSLAATALLFFALPPPVLLLALASPQLETALAGLVAGGLGSLGLPLEARGVSLVAPDGRLDLEPADGGLRLALVLATLGWYAAARRSAALPRAAAQALLAALLAIPTQLLAVLVAGVVLAAAGPTPARLWLLHGAWLTVSAAGLVWLHRPRSRVAEPRDDSR